MSETQTSGNLREAARDLHRYLSGEIAPMMVADSFETLAEQPPPTTARFIAEWIQVQLQGPSKRVPVSDYVFHSLKKLHILSEFELVQEEPLVRYLDALSGILVALCPEGERAGLKLKLGHLADVGADGATVSQVEYLHRAGVAGEPEAPLEGNGGPGAASVSRELRKLSLLLERIQTAPAETLVNRGAAGEGTVLAHVLSTAALEARSSDELERYLAQLRLTVPALAAGPVPGGAPGRGEPAIGEIFRTLGWSLPGWTMALPAESGSSAPASKPVEAMTRIVSLAPDAQESAKRLGEMIYAAIEQFNEGRLAQAVSILDAAARLIDEKKPDATMVQTVLGQAQNSLDEAALRRYADAPEKHGLLRRVLAFFPSYQPAGLLEKLYGQEKREVRKLLLVLLECHGGAARPIVLEKLAQCASGDLRDDHGWYRRNIVFLLKRIPRTDAEGVEGEIALLAATMAEGEPLMCVKEAIGALGRIVRTDSERALIDRLKEIEQALVDGSRKPDEESWDLLDRLCASLASQGTQSAIRTLAAHAFGTSAALGAATSRFDHLATIDLSVDPEQLAVLVGAIRDRLPSKLLGFVVKRSSDDLTHLIRAVSATPKQEVRAVLQEVSRRLERHEIGEEARRALAKLEPRPRAASAPSRTLSGDLELFALPNLLQSLADSQATGDLALYDPGQKKQATIGFAGGRIATCGIGRILGEDAVYQLFERPFPGTFVFRTGGDPGGAREAMDVMHLLLEGVRRHDEYQQAKAMIPDGLPFEPGRARRTPTETETDASVLETVWAQASGGQPADVCEAALAIDGYRVRTLYAHWLEEGALQPRKGPPAK